MTLKWYEKLHCYTMFLFRLAGLKVYGCYYIPAKLMTINNVTQSDRWKFYLDEILYTLYMYKKCILEKGYISTSEKLPFNVSFQVHMFA